MKVKTLRITFLFASMISLLSFNVLSASIDYKSCPSKKFAEFLSVFSDSSMIQERFTRFPLKKLFAANIKAEPVLEMVYLKRESIKFPIFPINKNRVAIGLRFLIVNEEEKLAAVKLEKPDTDYQVLYIFRLDGCWFLDEVNDYSL